MDLSGRAKGEVSGTAPLIVGASSIWILFFILTQADNVDVSQLLDYVTATRDFLRGGCMHEIMVAKTQEGGGGADPAALCPVIAVERVSLAPFPQSRL